MCAGPGPRLAGPPGLGLCMRARLAGTRGPAGVARQAAGHTRAAPPSGPPGRGFVGLLDTAALGRGPFQLSCPRCLWAVRRLRVTPPPHTRGPVGICASSLEARPYSRAHPTQGHWCSCTRDVGCSANTRLGWANSCLVHLPPAPRLGGRPRGPAAQPGQQGLPSVQGAGWLHHPQIAGPAGGHGMPRAAPARGAVPGMKVAGAAQAGRPATCEGSDTRLVELL